jgi:hypothetical protein
MLSQLHSQLLELFDLQSSAGKVPLRIRKPVEIVFVFDNLEVVETELRTFVASYFNTTDQNFQIQYLGSPEMVYFQLKNHGFQHTTADLIVFLDSDVIPDDGWLINLVGSFSNPEVQVVAGNPYVELNGIFSRAFALAWFFPLRAQDKEFKPYYKFWANNVAFRRETYTQFSFPQLNGYYRGSCMQLVQKLTDNGITIYLNTASQVSHPPPGGLGYFLSKGIAQGRNDLLTREAMEGRKYSVRMSVRHFQKLFSEKLGTIRKERHKVSLSLPGTILAMSITALYYSLYLTGEMMTHLSPEFMAKRFKL